MIEQTGMGLDAEDARRVVAERDALRSELEIQALNFHACLDVLWDALDGYQPLVAALLELLEALRVQRIRPNGPTELRLETAIRDVQAILFARWGRDA